MATVTDTPASLRVLARAEKRLTGMIARRGIDAEVLTLAAAYDDLYRSTLAPAAAPADDLAALVDATAEPVVSPVLLENAREETKAKARRLVMARWAAGTNQLPLDVQDVTR